MMDAVTIGIITDLHLGGHGTGRWHNRLLYDQAEQIAGAAIAALNRKSPDFVFILGDIADDGMPDTLRRAAQIFAGLSCPWYVLPGNHDRPAVRSGMFDAIFAAHALPAFLTLNGLPVIGLRESRCNVDCGDRFALDQELAIRALGAMKTAFPGTPLVIASHFPLLPEQAWADARAGKYAGHLDGGVEFLARVQALARGLRPVILCGHSHWHHISETPMAIQCTTAALVESPMESRLVTMTRSDVRIETLQTPVPEIAAASFDGVTFVAGQPDDRVLFRPLHTSR